MMKYYDVGTRRRPDFLELLKFLGPNTIQCMCGRRIISREDTFRHWNEGHFDTYDEYKGEHETE